jgi:hypothetical protein
VLTLDFNGSLDLFLGKLMACSLPLTLKITSPFVQLIAYPTVLRNGLPIIMERLSSSDISRITKSIDTCTLEMITIKLSQTPIGRVVDLSAI